MPEFSSPLSLRELLKSCTDRNAPDWERAWAIFSERYQAYIKAQIRNQCSKWRSDHLKLQINEVTNDIFAKIIEAFCTNDFKVLRDFNGHENDEDNERMFRGWLGVVCHNQTNRELRKRWWTVIQNQSDDDAPNPIWEFDSDMSWILYHDVVSALRTSATNRNLERDIHIFLLFTFGGFSEAMIRVTASMQELGHRVIQVVVNRMRGKLRRMKKFFF